MDQLDLLTKTRAYTKQMCRTKCGDSSWGIWNFKFDMSHAQLVSFACWFTLIGFRVLFFPVFTRRRLLLAVFLVGMACFAEAHFDTKPFFASYIYMYIYKYIYISHYIPTICPMSVAQIQHHI